MRDILALKHVSRILDIGATQHCLSDWFAAWHLLDLFVSAFEHLRAMLKYWLENLKQEVFGCCNVRESY